MVAPSTSNGLQWGTHTDSWEPGKSTTDSGWWLHAAEVARYFMIQSPQFLWIHKCTDLDFLGFQHPLQWLAYQANSSGCSYHGFGYLAYDVISFPATVKSSVSSLCSRHTPDSGYTRRESQIPRLYSCSPKITSTSISTSTAGGLHTNTNFSGATGHDLQCWTAG